MINIKPTSICLVRLGADGFEIIKIYPDVIPKKALTEISVKCMPLGAKDGDFTSTTVTGNYVISSLVFSSPSNQFRDNISSIVAIFLSMDYNPEVIRKVFSLIVNRIRELELDLIKTLAQNIERIYQGFNRSIIKITANSQKIAEIKLDEIIKEKKEKAVRSFQDDIWT